MMDENEIGRRIGRRTTRINVHMYQAVLPNRTWNDLERLSAERARSINDIIIRLARLGLIFADHGSSGGTIILSKEGHDDKQILVLF